MSKGEIRVFAGSDVKESDIKIELLNASASGRKGGVFYRVGEVIHCINFNRTSGFRPQLETRFEKGILRIRLKNANQLPSENDLLLIHIKGEKFPLFFVPEISRLREPASDVIECSSEGNSVRISALHLLPQQIYSIDGRKITTARQAVCVNDVFYPMHGRPDLQTSKTAKSLYVDIRIPELDDIDRKEIELGMVKAILKYYVCEFTGLLEKRFAKDDRKLAELDRFREFSHKVLNFKNFSKVKKKLKFFDEDTVKIEGGSLKISLTSANIGDYILVACSIIDTRVFTGASEKWQGLCQTMYDNSDELFKLMLEHIPMSELARHWKKRLEAVREKSMLVFPQWMQNSSSTFNQEEQRFHDERNKVLKRYEKMKLYILIDKEHFPLFK